VPVLAMFPVLSTEARVLTQETGSSHWQRNGFLKESVEQTKRRLPFAVGACPRRTEES